MLENLDTLDSKQHFLKSIKDIQIEKVQEAQTLFYQCQFNKVIELVNSELEIEDKISKIYKLVMLKSKSYFELNRRQESKEYLNNSIPQMSTSNHVDYLYTKGSLFYFEGEMNQAKEIFKQMLESNKDIETVFKALLALGNVAYSEDKKEESLAYLGELERIAKKIPLALELDLSLKIFKSTVLLYNKIDVARSKELLEETFRISIEKGWVYFAQRALYNMAKWYKRTGKVGESQGILKVLNMYVCNSDSRFLSHLVNTEFFETEHRSTQMIEVCSDEKVISIGQTDKYRLELKRWPLLFKLIELLANNSEFVSKEKISSMLWPTKVYKPKTFDPRIYDLVSRLKKRLELSTAAPLLIESGENGYRLNMA